MAKGTCSVDGCEKPARSRGWCNAHYERWRKSGIEPIGVLAPREPAPPICRIPDCEAPPLARGWCSHHYRRWQRTGDPLLDLYGLRAKTEREVGVRICGRCSTAKPLTDFPRDAKGRNEIFSICKACCCAREKQRRRDDPEAMRKRGRERYAQHPGKWRERRVMAEYGLTMAEVEAIYDAQDGQCAICFRDISCGVGQGPGAGHVDHDHATGAVRGFLCAGCNLGLGQFGDDPERLADAAIYLRATARNQLRAVE